MAKKISQAQLKNIVAESVKRILKEGHWNQRVYNDWEDVRQTIGDDTFISELYNWLDGDSIEEFLENIKRNYDLGYNEEEEDFDEETDDDESYLD